ncbi:MAG: hypothetical protein N4A33_01285 [Bacteriovoracaceae bacterium]|jgi:hypothetical protein|nr:hypothetical protein [Bacteriovoracaceae bacterium]
MKKVLVIISLIINTTVLAKTVARVTDHKGAALFYNKAGQLKHLVYGTKLSTGTDVIVDDNGALTLKTDDGTYYYLSAGSTAKLYSNGIELKSGKVWVNRPKESIMEVVQSANSKVYHKTGQFIFSFDPIDSKSELLVLTGNVKFSNRQEEELKYSIPAGSFSFVSKKYENGVPRKATRVGQKSYTALRSIFSDFDDLKKVKFDNMFTPSLPKRAIASVKTKSKIRFVKYSYKKENKSKKTSLKIIKKSRSIASVKRKVVNKENTAKVRLFRLKKKKRYTQKIVKTKIIPVLKVDKRTRRKPAAVEKKQIIQDLSSVSLFEKSLRTQIDSNPKYKPEINSLIDELKSYQDDFVKDY